LTYYLLLKICGKKKVLIYKNGIELLMGGKQLLRFFNNLILINIFKVNWLSESSNQVEN
jgi:hypothetical protein